MRHDLFLQRSKNLRGRVTTGVSVDFTSKMLGLPAALNDASYGRASAKTCHQDGGVVALGYGQFGTTWDDVNATYGFETEPAATNLALYSAGAVATYTASNVTDAVTPLTGWAASLQFGNNSVQRSATKSISVASGTVYHISIYIQMDDDSAPVIGTTSSTGDLSLTLNGVIATTNPLVKKVGSTGSLYRISCARTASATATHEAGLTKYTGQSSKTFRVVGIQVETGSRATSYIATDSATASRAADPLVMPLSAIRGFDLAQYTLFVQCRRDVVLGTNLYALAFTNGGTSNRVGMSVNVSNVENWLVDSAGVSQVSFTGATPGTATRKRAVSVSYNNFLSSQNGSTGTSDSSVDMPTGFTVLGIGNQNSTPFNGIIHKASLITRAYTQTELNGLTA